MGSLRSRRVLPPTLERAHHNQLADVGEACLSTLKQCAVTESELFNLPIDRPAAQFEVCQVVSLSISQVITTQMEFSILTRSTLPCQCDQHQKRRIYKFCPLSRS
jgi:hypothetical protein